MAAIAAVRRPPNISHSLRSPRVGLFVCAMAIVAGLALAALPHTLSAAPRPAAGPDETWSVRLSNARSDTLEAPLTDVLPAAVWVFRNDDWRIQRADSTAASGRIVTDWKPISHPLIRFVMGDVRARCVVELAVLGGDRTLVVFRGGIATERSLAGSPVLALADGAYASAQRGWVNEVRDRIADNRKRLAMGRTEP